MLRRNRALKSFGGAWVFPGGRVDQSDAPHETCDLERARAAACRETLEETGLSINASHLVSLSHWIPPVQEKRRFSTRFFVAKAPEQDVKIDDGEIHDYRWVCPKAVMRRIPHPDVQIMPPTYISLFELSHFSNTAEALSAIAGREDEIFETRFVKTQTGFVTLWNPDSAYDSGDLSTSGFRRRLTASPKAWHYEKDF